MSFILEALRKAERDRNLGRTPSLNDVTHVPPTSDGPRPSRRLIALIGLVLGLVALTVLMRKPAPDPPTTVAVASTSADTTPNAVTAEPARRVAAPSLEAIESPPPAPAVESLDELLDPDAEADEAPLSTMTELEALADELPAEAVIEPPAPRRRKPAATPPGLKLDETLNQAPEITASEAPVEAEPVDAPVTATAPPASGNEPSYKPLREMPSDYRAAFSNLRVDVHVFDADAARRWVMIDGRKYVESSTLPQGARIVEITPEGIAFDYRGQTALFGLNR